MEQQSRFFVSFERYGRKLVARSPLPYMWIVVGIVVLILGTSILQAKYSLAGVKNTEEVIGQAARQGDYALASKLLINQQTNTPMSEALENLVYPQRRVEQQIAALQEKLVLYPGDKEIYLDLANLNHTLGNEEVSQSFSEMVRILDPNK